MMVGVSSQARDALDGGHAAFRSALDRDEMLLHEEEDDESSDRKEHG